MIGAFVFLIWNSWKNRMRLWVRRLKQPRYLVGLIVGLLYFSSIFGQRFFLGPGRHARGSTTASMITPENAAWFEALGAFVLFAIVILAWLIPNDRAALAFSEAEIAFLFPAPVKRRTLIHYRLLKSQVTLILIILFFTFITGRFTVGKLAWIHAVAWWVIFTTLGLHRLGASFVRTWLLDKGISNWKRRVVVLTLVGAAVAVVVIWARKTLPTLDLNPLGPEVNAEQHLSGQRLMLEDYLHALLESGPVPYLLYPFRLVVRPYVALDWPEFFMSLWPALVLLVGHYICVLRSDVAFEEASIDYSRKIAEKVAAIRASGGQQLSTPTKKKKAPFKLRTTGAPAIGFLWKNLIGTGQTFTLRFFLLMSWIALLCGFGLASGAGGFDAANIVGAMAVVFLLMSFFIGPQWVRQDFRQDLRMMDVLKTYPLKGWQVVLGELAAPVCILTGLQWIMTVLAAMLCARLGRETVALEWRLALGGSLAMLAPALNAVILIIPNAAVLMFPAWFGTGKENTQGIDVMGQRIIFAIGQMFVLVGALLPAALVFLIVFLLAKIALAPAAAVPIGAAFAAVVLAAEAWLGLHWLGKLFEKFDLSLEQGS
jgi:ABC-2 type transport system permease protein